MNKDYTKFYDDGFLPEDYSVKAQGKSGKWHNCRPISYQGIYYRIRDAINILLGRADALYWTIDDDK